MPKHDMEIASSLRLALADKVGHERFDLWFGAETVLVHRDATLQVSVPSQFKLDWLRRQFRDVLVEVAQQVLGRDTGVEFRVQAGSVSPAGGDSPPQVAAGTAAAGKTWEAEHARDGAPVPAKEVPPARKRRFACLDSFVVGAGNRVAHTSAKMVAAQPGEVSPLVLCGPPGVGKTHLLEGIWSAARKSHKARRVVYLSAEQFTSHFLEALNGRGLPSFRRKYRDLDLLILDDVQFFCGKKATLVELQHTLDSLVRAGRQVVLAAVAPPPQLPELGPELVARLSGGLVCPLSRPDAGTRLEILRRLALPEQPAVPDEVLRMIAARLAGDGRVLNGALNRLRATSRAHQTPMTLASAEEALWDLFAEDRVVTLADVQKAVCEVLGVTVDNLQEKSKAKAVSRPRMLAMFLARKHTRVALSEIGNYFGNRSHTTVISAQKKVHDWLTDSRQIEVAGKAWNVEEVLRRIEDRLQAV